MLKARYETVAQALAVGKTQREAYQAGGYRYKPANAHRLCTDPVIIARVNEIVSQRYADERKARAIATHKAGLEESWIIERVKYVTEIALRGVPIKGPNGEKTYGQCGCVPRISISAAPRSMRCMPRRSSASARGKPARLTSSAARSVSPPP